MFKWHVFAVPGMYILSYVKAERVLYIPNMAGLPFYHFDLHRLHFELWWGIKKSLLTSCEYALVAYNENVVAFSSLHVAR